MVDTKPSAPKSVDDYMKRVSPKMRAVLQRLRRTIKAAAPAADETISYGIPAFRQNGTLVYYAAFKDHCSFFPGSATVRRRFASEAKPFGGGNGTLRFTPEKPIPDGLVTRIVKARVSENALRRRPGGRSTRPKPARRAARRSRA